MMGITMEGDGVEVVGNNKVKKFQHPATTKRIQVEYFPCAILLAKEPKH